MPNRILTTPEHSFIEINVNCFSNPMMILVNIDGHTIVSTEFI